MNSRKEVLESVEKVLSDFSSEENFIRKELETIQLKRSELDQGRRLWIPLQFDSREDVARTKENAMKRNKALKRELNILMGKLRSKQCYNPAEEHLNQMIDKYSEILSREDID